MSHVSAYAGTGVEQDCEEGCQLASEVGFLSQDVLARDPHKLTGCCGPMT